MVKPSVAGRLDLAGRPYTYILTLVTLIFFAEEEREREDRGQVQAQLGVVAMQSAKLKGGGALRGSRQRSTVEYIR